MWEVKYVLRKKMNIRIKVVAYIRVSTTMQIEGYSLENQEADIRDYCDRNGYELVKVFSDEGVSDKNKEDRDEFNHMMEFIVDNGISTLVIWKASRLSRKFTDFVNIINDLNKLDCKIISVKDGFDSSKPENKFMMYIQGLIAEMERDNILIQTSAGMYARAKDGYCNGGIAPFGYDYDEEKKELIINKTEAAIVVRIFESFLKGSGYTEIAKEVNSCGFQTKKGNKFSGTSIKDILKNPKYIGKIRWGYKQKSKDKKKDTANMFTFADGKHEGIISEDVYEAANEIIDSKVKKSKKGTTSEYLLNSVLRCPICGYSMVGQETRTGEYLNYYYVCGGYKNHRGCKKSRSVNMGKMDEQFVIALQSYLKKTNMEIIAENMNNSIPNAKAKSEFKTKSIAKRKAKLLQKKALD